MHTLSQQNIYQCVEETEYITDGNVPVPTSIGKVEQIGPSASSAKSAKAATPQMVSLIENQKSVKNASLRRRQNWLNFVWVLLRLDCFSCSNFRMDSYFSIRFFF